MVMAGEKYDPENRMLREQHVMLSQKLLWNMVAIKIMGTARSAPTMHMRL